MLVKNCRSGIQSYLLRPVFHRRNPYDIFEHAVEVGYICVSYLQRDFGYALLRAEQQFFRMMNADTVSVIRKVHTHLFYEQMAQIAVIDVKHLRELL